MGQPDLTRTGIENDSTTITHFLLQINRFSIPSKSHITVHQPKNHRPRTPCNRPRSNIHSMACTNRSDQRTHSNAEIPHSTLHSPPGCQLQRGTPNVPQSPHQTIAESCGSTRPAPDLADRAQENPPSNARATETDGSNRIPEHSPKKLKKYRITRAPPVPRTRSTRRSSATARGI